MEQRIRRTVLVPGLFEPRFALWPLQFTLRKHCEQVECFRDRLAFRNLDRSVDRLADMLCDRDQAGPIGVVTHSFGDWVARQAIARAAKHQVTALVSVAPALRAGLLLHGLHLVSGNLIPEVETIMDPATALANVDCDNQIRRLVIWAWADECVRPVDLGHICDMQVRRVPATHLSIILQPGVLKMIRDSLFPCAVQS